jgi:hypothetical protein
MKQLLFCLFLLVTSYGIEAADKPTENRGLEDAWVGEIEDTPTVITGTENLLGTYITQGDLEDFEKYLTFEKFQKNLGDLKWLTLVKPSGSLLSVYTPTIRYKKFPYCTAFAIKYDKGETCKILEVAFDYTSEPNNTGTIGLKIKNCDSIAHYKRISYNTADVLVKLYAEALQQEDLSRECRKD